MSARSVALKAFSQPRHVEGRASIADLFPGAKRCGLYVLEFSDGEIYAGQALDVTRRYVQHKKVHPDIEHIRFRSVSRHRLDEEERALIWRLEQDGERLRNISFTSMPKGESDFDLVMSAAEQEQWVKSSSPSDMVGTRVVDPELRRKYQKNFARLEAMPRFDELIRFLRLYVRSAIPVPLRSELSFWSCSCLPADRYTRSKEVTRARINLFWQVVLTVSDYSGGLRYSFHLARSPLERAFGGSLSRLFKKFPTLEESDNLLVPGGQDQVNLIARGSTTAGAVIRQAEVQSAMRLFNMRLMKKGPSAYSRYHCLELADRLVAD